MATITISAARADLSGLIARAQAGEETVLVRRKVPAAKPVPVNLAPAQRRFGALRAGW